MGAFGGLSRGFGVLKAAHIRSFYAMLDSICFVSVGLTLAGQKLRPP